MTRIFAFGSINLTDIFGVMDVSQVKQSLQPYLFVSDRGIVYLSVTFKSLKESFYNKTHTLCASKKGNKDTLEICKFQEVIHNDTPKDGGTQEGGGADNATVAKPSPSPAPKPKEQPQQTQLADATDIDDLPF